MKKIYFLFLLTLLPLVASAHDVEIDGIYYNLNFETKTATVTYRGTYASAYDEYSGEVIIPESVTYNDVTYSVTSIGSSAFSGCSGLTSVTIPNSVISIGDNAFRTCSKLTTIIVEDGNPAYDSRENCNAIIETSNNCLIAGCKNTTIPNSVISIGDDAFYFCGLTSVTIPNSVTSIKGRAFAGCDITSVTIPNSVISIGEGIFASCNNLSSITVDKENPFYDSRDNCNAIIETSTNCLISGCNKTTIPSSIISLGSSAFFNLINLSNIVIPEGVKTIGHEAFWSCLGLTKVELPSSLKNIDYEAFVGCRQMTTVISHIDTPFEINDNVFGIGEYVDGQRVVNPSPATLYVPAGTLAKYKAISGWTKFAKIEEGDLKEAKVDGLSYLYNSLSKQAIVTSGSYENLYTITIPAKVNIEGADYDVIAIDNSAFRGYKNLKSVSIPEGVKTIGNNAFYQTGITEVNLPSTLESVGERAFWNCNGFRTVVIPEGVKYIGDYAFQYCYYLLNIELPSGLQTISPYAFGSCTRLKTVVSHIQEPFTIPNNVFDISNRNNGVETISHSPATLYVPQNSIDAYKATESWNTFSTILPLEDILANIEFADLKVKEICVANWDTNGDGELSKLEALEVSDIGERFYGNKDITSFDELKYFKGLTSIPERAFNSCSKLESVVIPNTVTKIDFVAFYGCALTSITIPESVTNIDNSAFFDCHQLTTIIVDSRNPVFDSRDDCNAVIKTSTNTVVIGCKNTTFPNSVTIIGVCAFGYTDLTSITIPDCITTIEEQAFFCCSGLTSVVIPKTVTSIKGSAFADCNNLASIIVEADNPKYDSRDNCNAIIETETNTLILGIKNTVIPNNVTSIGNHAFNFCKELFSITIPNGVTSIGESAFSYCGHLTSIEIPKSVTTIGNSAFLSCSSLSSITVENGNPKYDSRDNCNAIIETATNTLVAGCKTTVIPSSVTTIGKYSFNQLGFMTFTIPGTVKTIDESAFNNCYMLSSINISEGVETIGPSAFSLCYDLESVELPSTLKSIGTLAFQSCREMKKVISHMEDPFALTDNIFGVIEWSGNTGEWVSYLPNITLYVPAGTKDKYAALAGWKDFKEIVEMGETASITIGKSGKASYCGDKSLDFSFSDEIKAYIATGFDKDEEIIWLTRVKDVPAGVPVLIKGEANQTYQVPVTDSQNSYYTNMFKGNITGETIQVEETDGDFVNYYLSGDGTFKSVKGYANIGNNKSYLQLPGTFKPAEAGLTQTVKVGSSGKASFAAPVDLDFTNVAGLKAFTATGYDKSSKTIWLTRVMKVQKGEGVLLKGDAKDYEIPSVAVQSSYMNMFVGNTSGASVQVQATSDDGNQTNYYLKGDGTFVSVNGYVNIGNNKSYLALPTSMVAAASTRGAEANHIMEEPEVIKLPISFRSLDNDGNGTTAIHESVQSSKEDGAYYSLQGQRVVNPGKGIYIKNGKKVVIK